MKTQTRANRTFVVAVAIALVGWGLGATDDKLTIGVVDLDQGRVRPLRLRHRNTL